jgi:hypothetical protein
MGRLLRIVLGGQAVYYMLTGIWPLLDLTTFQAVTGPKTDLWLVQMVGALAVAIGMALGVAVRANRRSPEILTLSVTSAIAFTAVDLLYAWRLSPVYLADAAVEIAIIVFVLILWRRGARP